MCSPRHRVSAALQVVLEVMLSRKHKHTVVIKWKIPDQFFSGGAGSDAVKKTQTHCGYKMENS